VPVLGPFDKTLSGGTFTLLHRARREACRLTITGNSNPEAGAIQLRVTRLFPKGVELLTGDEVFLRIFETFVGTTIEAAAPEGVASIDIIYEVRTGRDARRSGA
jgi:hypothetical protein